MSIKGGAGLQRFGTGSFGTGEKDAVIVSEFVFISEALEVTNPFRVEGAFSLSKTAVRVDFTASPDPAHAGNFDPANYTISGLTVLNVDPFDLKSVLLQTSIQSHILYTVVVNPASGSVEGLDGEDLNPLFNTATFQGDANPALFTAMAQSRRKIRLTFNQPMLVDAEFADPANYLIIGFNGSGINIQSIAPVGPDTTRAEILLDEDLSPFGFYTLQISPQVETSGGDFIFPDTALLQWKEIVPRPIRIGFERFSGEVTGGLLGTPAGQVFFSPALGTSVPNSVIQVDNVSVCTRAFDVYTLPSLPDPQILFTFPAPSGTSALLGATGGVLRASAYRLGLAVMNLSDAQEDTSLAPTDETPEGVLEEPIDITRASFLNDDRWRIFPGTGASLGAFRTADNLTPIGPGPTVGPFPIA